MKPLLLFFLLAATGSVLLAQSAPSPYPAMAPLDRYLIADQQAEIALARSAAPNAISSDADVMVLGRTGYTTVVKGKNGFVCIVERSWASPADAPDYWNPKLRAPNCFNAAAARSFLPIYLMTTKLLLGGKSKPETLHAVEAAFRSKQLPTVEPGSMCYMMSRQQYLNDTDKSWHPHMMFLVPGEAEKTWGANLPGSPIIAAYNATEHVTVFMILAPHWSDGTPAPPMSH